ncbi:unnamed protein product [Urochloa humidicola]
MAASSSNPRVFLEVTLDDGAPARRIVIELFEREVTKTVDNFRALCTGEKPLHYKGSTFHRCHGGDITCGESIYGGTFPIERSSIKHTQGAVSMFSDDGRTIGSQFFICCSKDQADWKRLDEAKHVVFGRVVDDDSMGVVRDIVSNISKKVAKIANCGDAGEL